jgi:diguanylate cyclase (GGDEF)-like protein
MRFLKSATARFGLRVALPALIILAGTVATVGVSLNRMAGVVNRVEDTLTKRSTEAAVQAVLRRIGQSHRDYAEWDDAARRLYGELDPLFVHETFDSATETQVFFDTAYVLDEAGKPLVGIRLGERIDVPLEEAFSPAINVMLDGLSTDGRTYEVRTGMVAGAWGLAVVGIGPIVPTSPDFESMPKRSRYLVLAKAFDGTSLGMLSTEYVLGGLRFARPGEEPADRVDLVDPTGQAIAALTWPPGKLGNQAHADVGPVVAVMLALIAITMAALIAIAVRGLNEIKRREDQASHAATHDALTGLPNRTALGQRLEQAVAAAHRDKVRGALIYLDLDGFKEVNDAYGHEVGDRLLRNVSAGFHTVCGDRMIARIGGDEFAVVAVDGQPVESAIDVGRLLIRYLAQPFDIDGRVISIGTSIGVAIIDETVPSAEEVLRRADVAMYQAKQQGRNRILVYDPAVDIERYKRLGMAAELRQALRSGALEIVYQPVLDAATWRVVAAEALLRWPRDGQEEVPPSIFIPVAEETGLIDELGAWTLRQACRDACAWHGIRIAVNVSPAQFRNPNFEILVSSVLAETGLPPDHLELEVTENYLIANPIQARRSINAIRHLGVAVALDDFGTGYSSIGYLRSFTFDKLKLDRSLIVGIAHDQRTQRFVQATIALADALDLSVAAEGVASEEEAILLRIAGCREFQGFFFAEPSSAQKFRQLVETGVSSRGLAAAARA